MSEKSKNIIRYAVIVLVLIAMCLLPYVIGIGIFHIGVFHTKTVEFTEIGVKLDQALIREYGLDLDESVEILEGSLSKGGQDPNVKITFRISKDKLEQCMDEKWNINPNVGTSINGKESEKSYYRPSQDTYQRYGELFHTEADENGEMLVLFWGSNPSSSWIK